MITVAVDFDDTLVHEDQHGNLYPAIGAAEAMAELRELGHRVVIHTCRTTEALERGDLARTIRHIADILDSFGIPFDEIWTGPKLIAQIYVDDRSVSFRGDWESTLGEIEKRASRFST